MVPVETDAKPQKSKHINNGPQSDPHENIIFLEFFIYVNEEHDYDGPIQGIQESKLAFADAHNFGGING